MADVRVIFNRYFAVFHPMSLPAEEWFRKHFGVKSLKGHAIAREFAEDLITDIQRSGLTVED